MGEGDLHRVGNAISVTGVATQASQSVPEVVGTPIQEETCASTLLGKVPPRCAAAGSLGVGCRGIGWPCPCPKRPLHQPGHRLLTCWGGGVQTWRARQSWRFGWGAFDERTCGGSASWALTCSTKRICRVRGVVEVPCQVGVVTWSALVHERHQ